MPSRVGQPPGSPSGLEASRRRITRHVARIDGHRVTWMAAGAGPPLVLVHGLGASARWWGKVLPSLVRDHTVLLLDLTGFGSSRRQAFRLDAAADLIADWLHSLGLARATFVGHSLGGLVAADLAAHRPDLVDRLVLVDAAGLTLPRRIGTHIWNIIRGWRRIPPSMVPVAVADVLRAGPGTMVRAGHQILATDLADRLGRIAAPTLIVWGEEDWLIPREIGERLVRMIPGARLELIPGCGHNPLWERPRELGRILVDFLSQPHPDPGQAAGLSPRNRAVGQVLAAPTNGAIMSRYVPVGDWTIHVRVGSPTSRPTGPPIVFVHGFVISSRYHVPTMERLATRHLVLGPDLPGFGWSSKPETVLDIPALAAALVATLDAAGIPRVVLVGNSMGSQTAAELADRYPERVDRAVLTGLTFDPGEPSLAHQFLRLVRDIPREKPSLWLIHVPDYVLTGIPRAIETLRHAWAHRVEATLPRITVPTLVVRGSRDTVAPRAWTRRAARLLPIGAAAEAPRAAHAVNHGAPDELAAIIERFLET